MRILRASMLALTLVTGTVLVACAPTESRRGTGEYVDDKAISTRVKTALIGDDKVNALAVNVETYRGVVQLSGFVDSQAMIRRAEEVARQVDGVKSVQNDIRVRPARG